MMIDQLRHWARCVKQNILVLYYAFKDPRTPWYTRAISLIVIAYALSPLDLIPDFVPVLGYLDDLILLPLGILLVIQLIPQQVLADAKNSSQDSTMLPDWKGTAGCVIFLWLIIVVLIVWMVIQ